MPEAWSSTFHDSYSELAAAQQISGGVMPDSAYSNPTGIGLRTKKKYNLRTIYTNDGANFTNKHTTPITWSQIGV